MNDHFPAGGGTVRNSPYNPFENRDIDAFTPNSRPTGNSDRLREVPVDAAAADLELMPCTPTTKPGRELPHGACMSAG